MAELSVVRNKELIRASAIDRAQSKELDEIREWMTREMGSRAVAIWSDQIVDFDDSTKQTGQFLDGATGSVAGVFTGIERVVVRTPREPSRSRLGIASMQEVAVFSTNAGPANISDELRIQMENNDTSIAGFLAEIGIPLTAKVAIGPLEDNHLEEEDDYDVSPPKLYVVK